MSWEENWAICFARAPEVTEHDEPSLMQQTGAT